MSLPFRFAPLVLLLFPGISRAQWSQPRAAGLEIPAPAAPRQGHFLADAYGSGHYRPLTTAGARYAVQPYLRYFIGTRSARPFVQYTFPAYWLAASAPVPQHPFPDLRDAPASSCPGCPDYYGGRLGGYSVGVPVRVGRNSAVLNLGGSLVEGLLWSLLR